MYNFSKVGGRKFKGWKDCEEGDYIIGKILRYYTDNYDHECPEIEVIETNFEGIKPKDNFGVNYTGGIAYGLKQGGADVGTVIRLEYKGEDEVPKGKYKGKIFHNIEVSIAEDTGNYNKIEDDSDDL